VKVSRLRPSAADPGRHARPGARPARACAGCGCALAATLVLLLAACTPAPQAAPATRLKGNWWSDGSYRVDRRDPISLRQYWHDQDTDIELLPAAGLRGIDAGTVSSLNAKCQAANAPDAFWLGWRMRRGQHNPLGIVCGKGGVLSAEEVAIACARVASRGHPLVPAWHKPEEHTFACREP
jgi:hypothetical protein